MVVTLCCLFVSRSFPAVVVVVVLLVGEKSIPALVRGP